MPDDLRPYHHGDLRQAMLSQAERILENEGIDALSLRAAARAVGVSHTAPRNHFGDMTGLLSELAADGFRRQTAALEAAIEAAGPEPKARLHAMGTAYVAFAARHPGLFTLMFRNEQLDSDRPALAEAVAASRDALRQAIAVRTSETADAPPLLRAGRAAAAWSLVHGYAVLMLEGRLRGLLSTVPETDAEALFEVALGSVFFAGVD